MPGPDDARLTAMIRGILNRHPAVGLAVGVVRDGALEFFSAHGLADVAPGRPITQDTVFRVASITKTFTAIAVLQLHEQGLVDLDAPANGYLRSYRLVTRDPSWRPPTVRHLLTHTAGLGEEVSRSSILRRDFGETVPVGGRVPTLAEYYRGRLRVDAEPGTRFRYTDHGPATLGQLVADVSRKPFEVYLREHVFSPLGMSDTALHRPPLPGSRFATGYTLGRRGVTEVSERQFIPAGAGSAFSTPRDMARYLAALLGGGTNEHGTVLEPATLASMFEPQYQPDPRIPGIGLAFFRVSAGDHAVVEHQGLLPGFDSQIFAAPDAGVGVMAFTNGTAQGGMWLPAEMGRLLDRVLGVPDRTTRTDAAHHPEVWNDLIGWYYLPGPITDLRLRTFMGAGIEVFVRRGELRLRLLTPVPALAKGFVLHPDDDEDPYVFRIDLLGDGLLTMKIVFSQGVGGATTGVHVDVMPVSAWKQPAATNPRRWATGALALAVAGGVLRRR